MQHFFIPPANFKQNCIEISDPEILHQMLRVLRMKSGEEIVVLDNTGFEFLCRIKTLQIHGADLVVLEKRKNAAEPEIYVTLYQALPKKMELFELVLQKGTEIGVSEFVPLVTERTERREIKRERLLKILKEAAEQSLRGKIPELREPLDFDRAIENHSYGKKILLHCRDKFPLLSEKLKELKTQSQIEIFIGPEGGFSENEIQKAKRRKITIVSLGPRVLRTETAGIAAASLIIL